MTLGADDFLPLFVWVLVKTNFVAAEIEAEYMWGRFRGSTYSYNTILFSMLQTTHYVPHSRFASPLVAVGRGGLLPDDFIFRRARTQELQGE